LFYLLISLLSLIVYILYPFLSYFQYAFIIILIIIFDLLKFRINISKYQFKYLFFSPVYFYQIWAVLSCLYIESGSYISEQFRYGFLNGSTAVLLLCLTLFEFGFVKNSSKVNYCKLIVSDSNFETLIKLIFISAILIQFYSLYEFNALPLLSSDRFTFFSESNRLIKVVFLLGPALAFVVGFLHKNKSYNSLLLLLFIYCFLNIIIGDKFSGISYIFISYLMGYSFFSRIRINYKLFFLSTLLLLIFCILIIVSYSINYPEYNLVEIILAILDRTLALQGHVWFGTFDAIANSNEFNIFPLFEIFNKNSYINPQGIDRLMFLVTDSKFAHDMLSLGITFTMGFPAILYAHFGIFNFILLPFIGLIFSYVFKLFYFFCIKYNIFIIFLLYLFILRIVDFLIMGRLYKIFDFSSFCILFLLFIFISLHYLMRYFPRTRL